MKETLVFDIKNSEKILEMIQQKREMPWLHFSIKDGHADINSATPLYIYGARSVSCIVNEGRVIYNFAEGHAGEKSFTDWALKETT